jgi:hypothetical protein
MDDQAVGSSPNLICFVLTVYILHLLQRANENGPANSRNHLPRTNTHRSVSSGRIKKAIFGLLQTKALSGTMENLLPISRVKVNSGRFLSVLEDRKGNFWFGTYGSGVYYYDGKSFQHFTTKEGLVSNQVNTIYEDKPAIFGSV